MKPRCGRARKLNQQKRCRSVSHSPIPLSQARGQDSVQWTGKLCMYCILLTFLSTRFLPPPPPKKRKECSSTLQSSDIFHLSVTMLAPVLNQNTNFSQLTSSFTDVPAHKVKLARNFMTSLPGGSCAGLRPPARNSCWRGGGRPAPPLPAPPGTGSRCCAASPHPRPPSEQGRNAVWPGVFLFYISQDKGSPFLAHIWNRIHLREPDPIYYSNGNRIRSIAIGTGSDLNYTTY